ncbi:MAG: VOC family protein [Acidobacteriota bacterium]|nr:VOC family protein [Acidobacteriota bacterium]
MATAATQLISGTDFVSVPTQDVERSARFYGEALGLRRSMYMPERHFAEFETGNVTLSVINAQGMGIASEHNPIKVPIALHVDDVQAGREELEGRGVTFARDNFDTGVCHMAFFEDPDGNALMLHHRYAPRTPEA